MMSDVKTVDLLITNIGKCLTLAGPKRARIGKEMREIGEIEEAAIAVANGKIVAVGREKDVLQQIKGANPARTIDANGRLVTPGLVDPHTHLVHGGSREHELALKIEGVPYLEILARGGGILSTVRATRQASEEELYAQAYASLNRMLLHGTTTVEAKSGYGLSLEAERKQLRVAHRLDQEHPIDLVHTFMGAHAVPDEYKSNPDGYVDLIIEEMIPVIASEGLAEFCDIFCERGVFTVEQSRRILLAARQHGLKLKIHADEIEALGGSELAGELRCTSAEHLMDTGDTGIESLKNGGVIAVLLPATSFNLAIGRYAPARKMIEKGVAVALSTDYNPGSSPTESMQIVMTCASLYLRMRPEEVLTAVTINAAYAIDRGEQVGSLEVGKKADIVLWNSKNLEYIPYHFGVNHVDTVIKAGRVVVEHGILTTSCPKA